MGRKDGLLCRHPLITGSPELLLFVCGVGMYGPGTLMEYLTLICIDRYEDDF